MPFFILTMFLCYFFVFVSCQKPFQSHYRVFFNNYFLFICAFVWAFWILLKKEKVFVTDDKSKHPCPVEPVDNWTDSGKRNNYSPCEISKVSRCEQCRRWRHCAMSCWTCDSCSTSSQWINNEAKEHILKPTTMKWSNINYCFVCAIAQTKIAGHLRTHKTNIEIEHIYSLPKQSGLWSLDHCRKYQVESRN